MQGENILSYFFNNIRHKYLDQGDMCQSQLMSRVSSLMIVSLQIIFFFFFHELYE